MGLSDKDRDNQHERRAQQILKRSRKWICVYPGCDERCIFSHAISESISLAAIAENGHLLTIKSQRKGDLKELKFGSISVHDATAFNGFCERHDALFLPLDTHEIEDAKSLMLQAYRTVVSECVDESRLAKLSAESYENIDLDDLLSKADATILPNVSEDQWRQQFQDEFKKIADAQTRRSADLLKLPTQILQRIDVVESQPLDGSSVITTEQLSHWIPYRRLSVQLPVAVNCMIHAVQGDEYLEFFFCVIPYAESTLVFGVVPKAAPESLLDKLMESFSSDSGLIDLVESVLIGSNEWYMAPSVLEEMSNEKREVFLHDCTFFNEHRFYEPHDMILLERARRALAQKKPELAAALRLEQAQHVPSRECFNVRHERMLAAMCSQPFTLRDM